MKFQEGYFHEDNAWTPILLTVANTYCYFNESWYIRRLGRKNSITSHVNVKRAYDVLTLTFKTISNTMIQALPEDIKKILFAHMTLSTFSPLLYFSKYPSKDKEILSSIIKNNIQFYNYVKSPTFRVIVLFMKIIGVKRTLGFVSYLWLKRQFIYE